jgi:hypothetical protein
MCWSTTTRRAFIHALVVLQLSAMTDGFAVQVQRHRFLPRCLSQSAVLATTSAVIDETTIHVDPILRKAAKIEIKRFHETWQWTYRGRTYNINYRVEGDKHDQPILLTHGFGANLNHFRYNIRPLVDAGYRVYAMDLLGFGASEKPTKAETVGFSIELFSQQIVDFITAHTLETNDDSTSQKSWILAGNSIGGKVDTKRSFFSRYLKSVSTIIFFLFFW